MHARGYNSMKEYWEHEREHAANGERAVNHYPIDAKAKPYVFRTWGEFFGVAFRGFVVTIGLTTVGFIVYAVGRMLWIVATR